MRLSVTRDHGAAMTELDLELKNCFDSGALAYRQGVPNDHNPWGSHSLDRFVAWDAGWRAEAVLRPAIFPSHVTDEPENG